jgi:hypothetical protein
LSKRKRKKRNINPSDVAFAMQAEYTEGLRRAGIQEGGPSNMARDFPPLASGDVESEVGFLLYSFFSGILFFPCEINHSIPSLQGPGRTDPLFPPL